MKNEEMSGAQSLFAITVIVAAIPLRAWAIVTLWRWFVVEPYGVRPLSRPVAFGLTLMLSLVTTSSADVFDRPEKSAHAKVAEGFAMGIAAPLLALGFGAVARLFM
jgi:hypothetical protein